MRAKTYRKANGVTRIVRASYGGKGNTWSKEWANKREAVRKRDGDKCCRCGKTRAVLNALGIQLQLNHVRMIARGGSDSTNNLQLECDRCHEKNFKHDHMRKKRVLKAKTAKTKKARFNAVLGRTK